MIELSENLHRGEQILISNKLRIQFLLHFIGAKELDKLSSAQMSRDVTRTSKDLKFNLKGHMIC